MRFACGASMSFDLNEYRKLGFRLIRLHHVIGDRCSCRNQECPNPGKHPLSAKWQIPQRYDDLRAIDNVGALTGSPSGIVVVDLDFKNGKNGHNYCIHHHLDLPPTLMQRTPTKGVHLVYKTPFENSNPSNKSLVAQGVEILGDGAQFVLAPSTTPNGEYEWANWGDVGIAEAPSWVIVKMSERKNYIYNSHDKDVPLKQITDINLDRAIERIERYPAAIGGSGGTQLCGLFRMLVRGFCMPHEQADMLARRYYNPRCNPPWNFSNSEHNRNWQHTLHNAPLKGEPLGGKLLKPPRPTLHKDKEITINEAVPVAAIEISLPEAVIKSGGEMDIKDFFLQRTGLCTASQENFYVYEKQIGVWIKHSETRLRSMIQDLHGQPVEIIDKKTGEVTTKPLTMRVRLRDHVANALMHDSAILKEDFFDTPPTGITFTNGFLNSNLELVPHSPEQRSVNHTPFAFDRDARCPHFEAFLNELFAEDSDSVEKKHAIQEFMGICLMGMAVKLQKYLIFKGEGRNGKSTLIDVLEKSLFPTHGCSHVSPHMWGKDTYRVKLVGSKFNAVSELLNNDLVTTDTFKQIISGDSVQACEKYMMPFHFRPFAGHIFACNELPISTDVTEGFWRRATIISFNRQFQPSAFDITAPVLQEAQGIMAWAVRGAERVLEKGQYTEVGSHASALHQWQMASDSVAEFLATCCARREGAWTETKHLYDTFVDWARFAGRQPMSLNKFGRRLTQHRLPITQNGAQRIKGRPIELKARALWSFESETAQ